jgi:transcription termination/antitermination protein NusG
MSDDTATPAAPDTEPVEAAPSPAVEPPAVLPETAEYVPLPPAEPPAQHHENAALATKEENAPPETVIESGGSTAEQKEPPAEAGAPAPSKKKRTRGKAAAETEGEAAAAEAPKAAADGQPGRKWYVVKVQSGREESIKSAIERKVKIEGLEEFFGRIEIPVEEVVEKKKVKAKVKDKKTGEVDTVYQEKNVSKKRKKFPGYLFAEVDFNDRILYLFRETSGVGDFVGATLHRAPSPMSEHEVQSMLTGIAVKGAPPAGKVKVKLDYEKGDKVKIRDGAFSGMEGEVKHISEAKDATETPKVKVEVTIFGRPVEVELDYWQVDKA